MMDIRLFWNKIIGVKNNDLLCRLAEQSVVWNLKKGDLVIREGDIVTEMPFLVSGVLKAFYKDGAGRERVFCFGYIQGQAVTSMTNLALNVESPCTIEVIKDCTLIGVPIELLMELIRKNIDVAHIYDRMLSLSMKMIVEHHKVLATCNISDRYQWFTETYPGLSEQVNKKDIASYLNMSPESLSRVISKQMIT